MNSLPEAGELLRALHAEWDALEVTNEPIPDDLPRPWDLATCRGSELAVELREWLDAFVSWLNEQQHGDAEGQIPLCWSRHPHLLHNLSVLADQRRRAQASVTSDALETWQRTTLPAFTDRVVVGIRVQCADGHQDL